MWTCLKRTHQREPVREALREQQRERGRHSYDVASNQHVAERLRSVLVRAVHRVPTSLSRDLTRVGDGRVCAGSRGRVGT